MNLVASEVLAETKARFPNQEVFSRSEIHFTGRDMGYSAYKFKELFSDTYKVSHGKYSFELNEFKDASSVKVMEIPEKQLPKKDMTTQKSIDDGDVYVPAKDACYIPWGNFTDVTEIIKSEQFYPTFITGLSGNGKTMMVEQACAKLKREYVRVQITPETDEDDLIGGFRLINGETVFSYGPVVKAMKHGAILLIDEIDRGSNKLMCLQSVLEGKSLLLKKTGEVVKPAAGFNIIATANTKGKGSDDGRYTAATILDDAFLERFVDTIEQSYPSAKIEKKIVMKHMEKFNKIDEEFSDNLITWAEIIRKTFTEGGVDEVVTTRRLCHIVQIYSIFNDKMKAITRGIARFDEDTKAAFADLYTKVDAKVMVFQPVTEEDSENN
jgi:MoxR-like ATPase